MAPSADTIVLPNGLAKGSEYPQKADLRKLMLQNPLPFVAPGTVDPASMVGDEPSKQARSIFSKLNAALTDNDSEKLESCFYSDQAYWKDLLALTYHTRTFATPNVIATSLLETKVLRGLIGGFDTDGDAVFIPATPVLQFIDCSLTFRTTSPAAACTGRALLLPVKSQEQDDTETITWKIWVLSTKLESLDGHPENEALLKVPGRQLDSLEPFEIDVFIVGGGNAAVTLAARLKALGVESIMAERNPNVGDNWTLRYDYLKFHVPTSFCELPYMYYDKTLQTPHHLSRDELAEQVRQYVAAFHLNIITSAEIINTTQTEDKLWHIEFRTPAGIHTATAKHLVQATGIASQKPYTPSIPDEQVYKGVQLHSSQYKNASELKNRGINSVLIVGSANTAFDVLEDCHAAGLQTTMVVRSPTYIVPVEYVCDKMSLGAYDVGIEAADRMFMTLPSVVDAQLGRNLFAHFATQEPDRYVALAKAGFPVIDSRDPQAALMHNLIERAGGHYVDVGGTKLLAEGNAGIKANVGPVAYTATGLRFSDGSTADADAVIWCTGFADTDARKTVADIVKADLPVDATWGIDEEGEIRGMWKRHLLVDNFWIMGGYTQQHRFHSKTLALQIKAALEGLLPPAYQDSPRAT